jgi:hypothetical protein
MALSEVELVKSAISPDGGTVDALPDLVAIFGGPLSTQSEIGSGIPSKSCRDAYIQWLTTNLPDDRSKTLMPESYEDWNNFDIYSDLLLFEADLGYLTAAIVVFLEAPGSIAELGAFSQITSLKDRLVIVVTCDRHPIKSFISLGPLRQLDSHDSASICVVPAKDQTEILNDINVINDAVSNKKSKNKIKRKFTPEDKQHQFALALDLIALIEVVTFTDIKLLFQHFRVTVTEHRIKQILFTLEKSQLVKKRRYGSIDYYAPTTRGTRYLNFNGNTTAEKFNRARLQTKVLANRNSADRGKVFQKFFPKGADV